MTWEVCAGELAVSTMRYVVPEGARPGTVGVEVDGRPKSTTTEVDGEAVEVRLEQPMVVPAGSSLRVNIALG